MNGSQDFLFVQPFPALRLQLTSWLQGVLPKHKLIAAENGAEALGLLPDLTPAFGLVELNLPDMTGFDFVRHFRQASPNGLVVVTSFFDRYDLVERAKAAGAVGYLPHYRLYLELLPMLGIPNHRYLG